jgi:beta-lactamase superfamily II metal-dependent hydrolase
MRKCLVVIGMTAVIAVAGPVLVAQNKPPATLDIYFIDTEGGQATLLVTPAGETLLFDTGTGGDNNRDADRITNIVKQVAVEQQLNHVIVSHYHGDHVGNAAELSRRFPIGQFWDHGGWIVEGQPNRRAAFDTYMAIRNTAHVVVPKPGAKIPMAGLDVMFISSAGETIASPLAGMPGAGAPNPLCRDFVPRVQDATPENAFTLGAMIKYGSFRMLDLSDLVWNAEKALVCPRNLLGTVDVYHTSRHGTDFAGSPALVHAVRPRIAIMNNGAMKGGTKGTFDIVRSSPGFEDFWQLHFSEVVDKEVNSPDQFIATVESAPGHKGHYLKLSARTDGSFTVTNERTGYMKEYSATRNAAAASR